LKKDILFKYIATVGFIGFFPLFPGTISSAVACILYLLFKPTNKELLFICLILFIVGIFASEKAEKIFAEIDSSYIVIDEFVGYILCIIYIPYSFKNAILAFFLFRFFDIFKPFPIKLLEQKIKGGIGIMIDDIVAALMTNICLRIFL